MTTADEAQVFTEQELKIVFGVCSGLTNKEISQKYGMTADTLKGAMLSVFDKVGVSNRLELIKFAKAALNADMQRRHGEKS